MIPSVKPTVALLMPQPRRDEVLAATTLDHLSSFANMVIPEGTTAELSRQLPRILPRVDACLTGWGAPPLTEEVLNDAPRLKLIAHTAGSIKGIIPLAAFQQGILVSHAAAIIAGAVAEATLLLMLSGLRRFHICDQSLRSGQAWAGGAAYRGHQLRGRTVGLIGCGHVARAVIDLLQPFDVRLLVYDPYLSPERARELGVGIASLVDLLKQSDIVSNHAPTTPETHHLLGAKELALLPEGCLFINTARAWTLDEDALLHELQTGRFWAALDVFATEPLPLGSPFRTLNNVFLTPHVTGQTVETYTKQGAAMVEELSRFVSGQPLRYQVSAAEYAIMA